jgi:copper chaperone NosL
MIVAITGKRKFLFFYIILTVIGGALAIYDFYQWGYDYGHNLDPKAPIQIPGFSYQPPVFGHKRLLNFDAYSFPDVGGWIVIAAGSLATMVWFVEWYRHRKPVVKSKLVPATAIAASLIFFVSCDGGPEPFNYGSDACHACKMGITDPKFGGEVITKKGKVYKFDDVICMKQFLRLGETAGSEIKRIVVINFLKQNDFIDANKAHFLISEQTKSPMGSNAAAFTSAEEAEKFNAGQEDTSAPPGIKNWDDILFDNPDE